MMANADHDIDSCIFSSSEPSSIDSSLSFKDQDISQCQRPDLAEYSHLFDLKKLSQNRIGISALRIPKLNHDASSNRDQVNNERVTEENPEDATNEHFSHLPDIVKSNTPPTSPTAVNCDVLQSTEDETCVVRQTRVPIWKSNADLNMNVKSEPARNPPHKLKKQVSFMEEPEMTRTISFDADNASNTTPPLVQRTLSDSGQSKRRGFRMSSGYGTGGSGSEQSQQGSQETEYADVFTPDCTLPTPFPDSSAISETTNESFGTLLETDANANSVSSCDSCRNTRLDSAHAERHSCSGEIVTPVSCIPCSSDPEEVAFPDWPPGDGTAEINGGESNEHVGLPGTVHERTDAGIGVGGVPPETDNGNVHGAFNFNEGTTADSPCTVLNSERVSPLNSPALTNQCLPAVIHDLNLCEVGEPGGDELPEMIERLPDFIYNVSLDLESLHLGDGPSNANKSLSGDEYNTEWDRNHFPLTLGPDGGNLFNQNVGEIDSLPRPNSIRHQAESDERQLRSEIIQCHMSGLLEREQYDAAIDLADEWSPPSSAADHSSTDIHFDLDLSVDSGPIRSLQANQLIDPEFLSRVGTGYGVISLHDQLLMGAQCNYVQCEDTNCQIGRELLQHLHTQLQFGRGFRDETCSILLTVLWEHAEECDSEPACPMPFCSYLHSCDCPREEAVAALIREHYPADGRAYHLVGAHEDEEISEYNLLHTQFGFSEVNPPQEGVDFHIITRMGTGSSDSSQIRCPDFSNALLATVLPNKHIVIKKMKYSPESMEVLKHMRDLTNANILPHLWCLQLDSDLVVATVFAHQGTLDRLIQTNGGRLTELHTAELFKGLLEGLTWLHSRGVLYLMWTARGIMMTDEMCPVLGDFSCALSRSSAIEDDDVITDAMFTLPPYLIPPELFYNEVDLVSDIWGVACLAIEMVTGGHVHVELRHLPYEEQREKIRYEFSHEAKQMCSPSPINLVLRDAAEFYQILTQNGLSVKPGFRPTVDELLNLLRGLLSSLSHTPTSQSSS